MRRAITVQKAMVTTTMATTTATSTPTTVTAINGPTPGPEPIEPASLFPTAGPPPHPVMMLWSPALAVVPVTIHLSLRDAIAQLSSELIVTTARIVVADLKARFGLANPRLSVSGLNPHAGEDGSLGTEDRSIVAPAFETLRSEGIEAHGPLPADTM